MAQAHIGLIGLGVMGHNLALNFASKGINVSVYNRTPDKTDTLSKKNPTHLKAT
jgi:6-phosphogluconate dehydrogenase